MSDVNLPNGWVAVKLGEISEIKYGKGLPTKQFKESGYPVFGANGVIGYHDKYSYEDEQLLISCRGANSGTINFSPKKCFITNNSLILDFHVEPVQLRKTLFYFLQSANKSRLVTGTAQPQVTINNAVELNLALPPLNEQHRIVAKIEELFSELDKGIENLKTARAQLKVYRQALLKHAFEGKLTAQWREQSRDKLETAAALLARIKNEREQRYQQQLQQWQTTGGSKPKAPKSLPPLTADELAELPELPEGWGWVKVDAYCDAERNSIKAGPFGSSLKKEFYVKKGYKVYGQEQVISGDWQYGDYFIDEAKYLDLESCKVKPFDILISLVGTVGKVLVLPENITPGVINPRLVKISPNLNFVVPEFFKYYFESAFLKGLYKLKTHGATMDVLNLGIIQELPFPICSFEEQQVLIQEIESRLSEVDQLELTITTSLQQSEALRQSILKKAFSGQLVAQDANDEPAAALLARIKAERKSPQPPFAKGEQRRKASTGNKLLPVESPLAAMNKVT